MLKKLVLLTITALFFSCSIETDNVTDSNNSSLNKGDDLTWVLDHYTNNTTHRIGIWPAWDGDDYAVPISEYKNKYGFNDILVHSDTEWQICSSLYSRWNIIVKISDNGWWRSQIINKSVTHYYYDEPIENGCSIDTLVAINNFIDSIGVSRGELANLYLGCAIKDELPNNIIQDYKNFIAWRSPKVYMLHSSYSDYLQSWGSLERSTDVWDNYKHWTYFGTHSQSNWIGALRDMGAYDGLINHANILGLNSLWFYIGGDGGANNVAEFAYELWENGWLNERIERCLENGTTRVAKRLWYDSFPDNVPD